MLNKEKAHAKKSQICRESKEIMIEKSPISLDQGKGPLHFLGIRSVVLFDS